jgi:hypothetical protein
MTVDLVSAMARIPHLGCHSECAPAVPGGRDGSGRICRDCALALAAELVRQAGSDLWDAVRAGAWQAGYLAGVEAGTRYALEAVRRGEEMWRRQVEGRETA